MYRSSFLGQGCRNVFRSDCLTPLSSKLSEAYRRKILLAPHHARYGRNDIVLERSCRSKFGNETLMQFLEVRPIFAREDSGRGVAAVFEGWMNLIYWSWHGTLTRRSYTDCMHGKAKSLFPFCSYLPSRT